MIKCVICGQEVTSKRGLAFHIKKHGIESVSDYIKEFPNEIDNITPKDETLLTCPICGRYNLKQLGQHIVGTHKMTHEEFSALYPNQKMFIDEISERCRRATAIGHAQYMQNCKDNPEKYRLSYMKRAETRKKNNPDIGIKISSILRNNGTYDRMSSFVKELWKDQEYRKMQSEKCKKQHENGLTDIILKSLSNGKYPVWINGKFYMMRSTWEVRFANTLFALGIEFEYESIKIPYYFKGKQKTYFPDFVVCDTNIIFEVKPNALIEKERNVAKMNASIEQGFDFRYITEDVIFGNAEINLAGCFKT